MPATRACSPSGGPTGTRPLSEQPVDLLVEADPVAAFLTAHASGTRVALRTSGSAGAPRSVVRTTASWWDSLAVVADLTHLRAGDRLWVPGPLASTMNLFAAVLARHVGADLEADPGRATHAHLTPAALERALESGAVPAHVTVAGDRLGVQLRDRARAGGVEVAHYYGASELSFVAWGTSAEDLRPFPGVDVEVREKEIWVRSAYLAQGYLGAPGPLRREGGWGSVGDRGSLEQGILRVSGRGSGAVTTAGATVLVSDVEAALAAAPGMTGQVLVVGLPHQTLGQVVAAVLTDASDFEAAHAAAAALDAAHRPRVWVHLSRMPDLPTTPGGKVDRIAVAGLAATAPRLTSRR